MAQEPQTLGTKTDGWGSADCRNSIVGAGLPEAENHWREWGQHTATAPCYSIAAGLIPVPSERDPEINFI